MIGIGLTLILVGLVAQLTSWAAEQQLIKLQKDINEALRKEHIDALYGRNTMKEKARKIAAALNIILTTLGRHTERIVTWVKWLTLLLVAIFAVNLTSIDFSGKYTVSTTDHNTGETTTRVFEVDQDANSHHRNHTDR